jgi:hypothetical protein
MSWLYSQALVEEYLGENCLDGEQSVQSNGKPTQQAYCAPDKMTDFSRLSRFGMTYKPLTENLGAELLTLYLAGFHVKTFQPQEKGQELTGNDQECGRTWRGWLAKYDPNMSLWRTAQCSLFEDLNESLAILPKSGMTQNGLLWELPMLAQTTKEIESGFWATPTTMDKLPPKSQKALHKEATIARPGRSKPANLRDQVSNMQNWPTPTVCGNYNRKGLSKTSGDGLATAVMRFPTPTAHNAKETNAPSEALRNEPSLAYHAGGKLNPTWVEWLMGWPLGWTDLKPLEMDKSHFVPPQHGDY